jgi:hypothetical protein
MTPLRHSEPGIILSRKDARRHLSSFFLAKSPVFSAFLQTAGD